MNPNDRAPTPRKRKLGPEKWGCCQLDCFASVRSAGADLEHVLLSYYRGYFCLQVPPAFTYLFGLTLGRRNFQINYPCIV
jgi:hypothetical protein